MKDALSVVGRSEEPLPHDIGVEQELLGALLLNNAVLPLVQEHVEVRHFYEPLHQQIFRVCSNLILMGKPATPTTVGAFLPKDITVDGGPLRKYLAAVVAASTTVINAPEFARIVRDLADYRDIIVLTQQMTNLRDSVDPSQIATAAIERLSEIVETRSDNSARAVDMAASVTRAVDAAALAFQNEGKLRGLSYGLRALDDKTLGAKPGELVVIAGRPGMGKSALMLGCARNQAEAGEPVMIWSGEMTDSDLSTRMIADRMWTPRQRLTYWQIASGKFREEQFDRVAQAALELGKLPIRIEQQPGLTVAQIGARARQLKRRSGLKALWVDHLGLVRASERYAGNKVNETGEVTQGLKALAKELGVPVYLLCQINRGVESREDKRPQLSDLRNSGDIEQDADTVLILYRPAYYLAKKEPPAGSAEFIIWADEMAKVEHRLDCIIEKQRSGPVGVVRLFCDIGSNAVRDEFSEMDETIPLSDRERADFK